jgi:pilus assembly protein CpaC
MTLKTRMLATLRLSWLVASAVTVFWCSSAVGQERQKIRVAVGESVTHQTVSTVKTVSIANSDVADVIVAGPQELLINGKGIGITTLVMWSESGRSTMFDVVVRGQFSDQKIEIQVQLAELNHTVAKEYGLDMLFNSTGDHEVTAGTFPGDVAGPKDPMAFFDGVVAEGVDVALRYAHGDQEITAIMRALASTGALRVLAEPTVVAASGETASFLSGGEIPVPIASAGTSGGTTVTIEWKEFGIKVNFVPTIVDEGVINLKIAPEASSLDFSNGVQVSGFFIPAIRTRKAETTVELRHEEKLVIGGLIMEEEVDFESKIPILGDIPLLGYLFRGVQKSTTVTELLIVVSPKIVRALAPGTRVPLPTDRATPFEGDPAEWGNSAGSNQ